jgi:hypothetical protein
MHVAGQVGMLLASLSGVPLFGCLVGCLGASRALRLVSVCYQVLHVLAACCDAAAVTVAAFGVQQNPLNEDMWEETDV